MGSAARAKRAFSLVETIVTLVLIGVLAAVLLPQILSSDRGSDDTAARQSLTGVVQDQSTLFSIDGSFSDNPARLSAIDNERSFVGPNESSSAPDEASVAVAGSSVGVAVRGKGETCWYLLKNFESTTGPQEVWALKDDSSTCQASDALTLTLGDSPNDGSSSTRPLRITQP